MLVLTRKAGEAVVIDGRITVRVLSTTGHRTKIGIDAPSATDIVRGELASRPVALRRKKPVARVCVPATAGDVTG